ncbi:MAG: ribosomal L7Ae/L30e/S12e/Gadd45 family protein [Bacillota bacterium]|nr:ribosomal L7Ae/L30e/S12e/Gadd45 family protein [Bacillota bacterium]
MGYPDLNGQRAVGIRAVTKAVLRGQVERVYIARDADEAVVAGLRKLCQERHIPVVEVPTMGELGRACGIEVGASAAAVLRE